MLHRPTCSCFGGASHLAASDDGDCRAATAAPQRALRPARHALPRPTGTPWCGEREPVGKARWPLSVSFHVPSNEHAENRAVPSPHVPTSHGAASRANSNLLALPNWFLADVTATSSPCTSGSSGYYARRMHNYRTPVLLRAPFIRSGGSLLRPWSAGVQPPSAPAAFRSTSASCGAPSTDIPHCFSAESSGPLDG